MGSRRTTSRSSSGGEVHGGNGRSSSGGEVHGGNGRSSSGGEVRGGNGRSSSGGEVRGGNGGNGRSSSCSYLSNVRPENRSTLCSVMAQLTEETQPSFLTTLRSKAVSEDCSVKFSCVVTGHPTPQLTWYKDDMQLDRYCGLPKYEIFRNGKNHSLHIYNCTVDDAAIYQASASNSKGIVSCSGVLEVGEMNEFKIHQRYFGKLKQKAELRRREAEGKENQEPLRTISPDRTQRKRRSNMDEFLSTPSSAEDEGIEEAVAVETETRLQEVEKLEEKPVANGAAPPVVNGQDVGENAKSGTYVYEPKAPFVKKKIKISNSGESEERKAKDESLTSVAESVKPTEESMEVENVVRSTLLDSKSRNATDRYRKADTEEVPLTDRPSKGVEVAVPVSLSGTEVKKANDGRKDPEIPQKITTQRPSVPQQNRNLVKEIANVGEKSKTLTDGSLALRKTVNAPRESRTASQPEEVKVAERSWKGVDGPSEKERRPASGPGGLSGTEVQKVAKYEKNGRKDTESPQKITTQRPSAPQLPKNIVKEIVDVSQKSKTLTDGSFALRKTVNAPRESRTASSVAVKPTEESMEVKNSVSSPVVDSKSRNLSERHRKPEMEEVTRTEKPSKGVEVTAPSEKEQRLASVPESSSGTEVRKAKDGRKDPESPQKISTRQPRNIVKEIVGVSEKSKSLTDGSLALRKTVNAPRESRTASSQRNQTRDRLKETSVGQEPSSQPEEVPLTDGPSEGVEVAVPGSLSGAKVKKVVKNVRKDTESPQKIATQRPPAPQQPESVDVGEKSKTLTDGSLALRKTVNAPRESRTASSQRDQTRDQPKETSAGHVTPTQPEEVTLTDGPWKGVDVAEPSEKERRPASGPGGLSGTKVQKVVKNVRKDPESPQKISTQRAPAPQQPEMVDASEKSVKAPRGRRDQSRDQLLEEPSGEVTPSQTKMNRNDPPVGLELPPNPTTPQPPPRKSRSDRNNPKDDPRTASSQPATDQTKQESSCDHSQGSNESQAGLFTDVQKSSQQSENSGASNVSYAAQKSQMNTAINTVEGTEIQVDEKEIGNEVGKLLSDSDAEKKLELHPENAAPGTTEHTETEKIKHPTAKDADVIIVETSNKETEKNDHMSKASVASQNLKSSVLEPEIPSNQIPDLQIPDLQEVRQPETKVISVAELLRSQIKALESPLAYSSFLPDPTTTCEEFKERSKMSDRKTQTSVTLQTNVTETLVEEQIPPQCTTPPPVQALRSPRVTSNSVVDTVSAKETNDQTTTTTTSHNNEGVTKISQETEASTPVLPKDIPNFPASPEELSPETVPGEPASPQSAVTPTKPSSLESDVPVSEHVQGLEKLPSEAELNHNDQRPIAEMNSPDSKLDTKNCSLPAVQTSRSILGNDTQENHVQPDLEDFSGSDSLENPSSPLLKQRDSPIPSATPQELASGARRKILAPKSRSDEASEAPPDATKLSPSPGTQPSVSPSLSRHSPLLQLPVEQTSPSSSPLQSRTKTPAETQTASQTTVHKVQTDTTKEKPAEKDTHDPFKAPQVIRKIRAETFADTSGHLKLWCQFFNVLSDSTIRWSRNSQTIAHIHTTAGDENQVNLAVVQASARDAGVYGCSITNEFGSDSTDCLLSAEILAGMSLREDLGVGEEIEMTPMIFNKGVADSGVWGNKFFGRIMMQESHIGVGCSRKAWRAKVIYGLEPVFESGNSCVIKVGNPVAFGGKAESSLSDSNLDAVTREIKIQNLAREYCKIFSAEARAIENFGPSLEVIPVYLMYRPANPVPYATVEAHLTGVYHTYCQIHSVEDPTTSSGGSEVELKCAALQHWMYDWTSGNLLLSRLEGVDTKITNVRISIRSSGHQGLPLQANPKLFERFVSHHQCNYFCGLLGLRSLKVMDTLLTPSKSKSSRSPLLQRKPASASPQPGRRAGSSPRIPRKPESEGRKHAHKPKTTDTPASKTETSH